MDDTSPYSPPKSPYMPPRPGGIAGRRAQESEGSFALGLLLGLFFGLWGWLGCVLLAKGETKRGALFGFLGRILAVVLVGGAMVLFGG